MQEQWTQQAIADARAGKKPYSITPDGRFRFSPTAPLDSLTAAVKDGVIQSPSRAAWNAVAARQTPGAVWQGRYDALASDPHFDPVDYYAQHPTSPQALTTAREVFKRRAHQPTHWGQAALDATGGLVKGIPSAVWDMGKGVVHGVGNVGTEVLSADGSPAAGRARLENAAATQSGLTQGRDLAVGIGRNFQRLTGKTDGKLSDREIEERIQADAASRQFQRAAAQGEIERPGWLQGAGKMNAEQLRDAGQAVRPGVIQSESFMGNPATALAGPAAKVAGPLVGRWITGPILKGTGKLLTTAGQVAGTGSELAPKLGRLLTEAGHEATRGAAAPAGQSALRAGVKGTAQGMVSGTALALSLSPEELAHAAEYIQSKGGKAFGFLPKTGGK